MPLINRSQLMKYLGAEQKNTVWSWCAVNHEEKKVYLSLWTDLYNQFAERERKYYTVQAPSWSSGKAGYNDQQDKLALIFEHGYEAYGYFNKVVDKNAVPRQIEKTITSFYVSLELERLNSGEIIAYINKRFEVKT